jgi:tetratricopeptide (TPR) repeat protein
MRLWYKKLIILVLLTMATASVSGLLFAQASECGKERGKTSGVLDEVTYKRLNDIYEDVGNELYDVAYDKLVVMIKRSQRSKSKYLKATLYQMMAQIEWARSNFDSALVNFEQAIELDALPDNIHFSLMYQVAQLYYMQERYDDALDKLALWMCMAPEEKIKPDSYVLKASIYAQKKDWKNVIPAIGTAISMSEAPKEPWYQLKLASYFELEQFPKAAQTLETMIQLWPDKKDYWVQLSQVNYMLKKDDKALSVIGLAYRRDMLNKQTDIMYLSNLYSNRDVPFKAAEVLQKGMKDGIVENNEKHWTMVADAWYAAEEMENALLAFEQAGKKSSDGDIDLRRGYILVDLERWDPAIEALEAALEKGGFNDRKTGEAYVLLGMSYFSLEEYSKASTAWGRAGKYPKSKKAAKQWMNHMREERARKVASN